MSTFIINTIINVHNQIQPFDCETARCLLNGKFFWAIVMNIVMIIYQSPSSCSSVGLRLATAVTA